MRRLERSSESRHTGIYHGKDQKPIHYNEIIAINRGWTHLLCAFTWCLTLVNFDMRWPWPITRYKMHEDPKMMPSYQPCHTFKCLRCLWQNINCSTEEMWHASSSAGTEEWIVSFILSSFESNGLTSCLVWERECKLTTTQRLQHQLFCKVTGKTFHCVTSLCTVSSHLNSWLVTRPKQRASRRLRAAVTPSALLA